MCMIVAHAARGRAKRKRSDHSTVGLGASRQDLVRDGVGVDHRHSVVKGEQLGDGRLAAGDATRQADELHSRETVVSDGHTGCAGGGESKSGVVSGRATRLV